MTTRMIGTNLSFAAALALLIAGCDSADESATPNRDTNIGEVKKEAGEAARAAGRYLNERFDKLRAATYEKKEEFATHADEAMNDLDASWDEFQKSSAELGEEAKQEGREAAAKLEPLRDDARAKLQRVKVSSSEAWDETRDGFVNAYNELREALSEAREKVDSTPR